MTASKLQRENQSLCAPLLGTQLHTQGCLHRSQERSWHSKFHLEVSWRAKTCPCGFPSPVRLGLWSRPQLHGNNPWENIFKIRFSQRLGTGLHRMREKQASFGREKAANWPVWKPLFGKNGLASPKGDLQIRSEVVNSRGRVLVPFTGESCWLIERYNSAFPSRRTREWDVIQYEWLSP